MEQVERYFNQKWDQAYINALEAVWKFDLVKGRSVTNYLKSNLPRVTLISQLIPITHFFFQVAN